MSFDLPTLDAFCDDDLALAVKQRDDAHFTQVKADGVVRFVEHTGRQVEIDLVLVRLCFLFLVVEGHGRCSFEQLSIGLGNRNIRTLEALEYVLDVVGRHHVFRQLAVELIKAQALSFACRGPPGGPLSLLFRRNQAYLINKFD